MFSFPNIIFFVAFLIGVILFWRFDKWNDEKLTPKQLEEIRNELSSSKSEIWMPIILGGISFGITELQRALGYENLGLTVLSCFLGFLLSQRSFKKEICYAKLQIPSDYVESDRQIVFYTSAYFITLGLLNFIIFLRFEFF